MEPQTKEVSQEELFLLIKKEMDKFGNDQNNREGKNKFDAVSVSKDFFIQTSIKLCSKIEK